MAATELYIFISIVAAPVASGAEAHCTRMGSIQQGGQHQANMVIQTTVHNEYLLPVMVYGSGT